jgi:hypothetical protein
LRIRPTFFLIGAARAGTTALYHSLSEHPDIFMPQKKEPHFFSVHWERGLDWYAQYFEQFDGQKAVGEASVSYSYPPFEQTPERIHSVTPEARFIYLVREPVKRAYSHYNYYRFYASKEQRSVEQAFAQNPVYKGASRYSEWIERYTGTFGPDKLMVIVFEEYVTEPEVWLPEIYSFLGVDPEFVPASLGKKTNASFRPRSEKLFALYHRIARSPLRTGIEAILPQGTRPIVRNIVHGILGKGRQSIPPLPPDLKLRLQDEFRSEVAWMEEYFERPLPAWKP